MQTIVASQFPPSVSVFVEIPEGLHESYRKFLDTHPEWDCDRVMTQALAMFLLQNTEGDRRPIAGVYLDTLGGQK